MQKLYTHYLLYGKYAFLELIEIRLILSGSWTAAVHKYGRKFYFYDGLQQWPQSHSQARHLEVTDLFKTLRIQSLDDNRLTFEMSSEIFVRAMKSFSGGSFGLGAVKLKLVKRHNAPYLLLSVDDRPGNSGISRASIFQTVPIRILRADQFRAIKEPETQDADVVLFVNNKLPSILKLCERYKNIGSRVHISANNSGVLKIGVQNDHVKVDTSWTGLVAAKDTARESSENYVSQRDPEEFASVWVDAKELYNVLRIHNSVMNMILCELLPDHAEEALLTID